MNHIMRLLMSGYYIPGGRAYRGLDGKVRVMLVYRGPTTIVLPVLGKENGWPNNG